LVSGALPVSVRSDLDGVSVHQLSELIGAIYDCALDPQRWAATCQDVVTLSESSAGGICVHDLRHAQNDQLFVSGYAPAFLEQFGRQYADSPMAVADVVANVGDISILSKTGPPVRDTRFYRDVMHPFGLQDMIWFPALRTGGRVASMHASRSDPAPRFQQREVDLFGLLAPHVCRALAISDLLDIRALQSEALERTLDGLAAGVFLVARDGHVVYMNPAAQQQARQARALCVRHNRLVATDAAAQVALSQAIANAERDDADVALGGHATPLPDGRGGGVVATVLPVDRGRRHGILAPLAASVAVFTQDPVQAPVLPGEAFARMHGLTGAELRVLLALAQGLSGLEVADMLGISEATVRTHLQRLYAKTATARQTDLLRLLHQSAPPVRSTEAGQVWRS
jgi:DNA-binding CsgD family transcriptional regulator/PAS domain-containing protein